MWEPSVGSQLGSYELRAVLGRGGTSAVFRAFCSQRQCQVAIKVLRQEFRLDAAYRGRLEREGAVLQKLHHPNLLRFLEFGEQSALLYIAMEFVSGMSLRQLLQMRGKLEAEQARSIFHQVLAGLSAAHQHGILHRDLKPENVLLGDQGEVKLSDFGCAKGPGLASVTAEGVVLGTPTYMAPEHFTNRHTPLSDQYSAAIMLYEMLCGRVPFPETEPVALAMAHVGKKPPSPQSFTPELSESCSQALLKALAKIPEQRFADLDAFAAAL
ncbi:serine/threonine protein kinase [bacterium]|nr:serine/threonine protein kinase [bacterium]